MALVDTPQQQVADDVEPCEHETRDRLITGFVTRGTFQPPASPNQGVTFDSLLVLMRNGNSYVNVHTSDPTKTTHNTGPGDFPAGEIRGQLAKTG